MDNEMTYRMPLHRCFILALILTFLAVLYYGYYSYSFGDYMHYSLGAVNKLYPGNFIRDAYVQTYNDFHPTFTWLLYHSMVSFSEIMGPFIIFIVSKFILFFGIILLAKRFIREKILYIFFFIFLFPYIYFGLANSTFGFNFPFPVPRTISWGLFFIGFHFFLSRKYLKTSFFWGVSALFHVQFIFLTFSLLILGTVFFNPFKKLCLKNIYPVIVLLAISSPEFILIGNNLPFQAPMADKDYYYYFVEQLFYSNMNPRFFLLMRGDIFFLLCLPIVFFWKKIQALGDAAKIWLMSLSFIFIGTLICIFFTEVIFIKTIMLMWFPGFTPFIVFSSIVFLIVIVSRQWLSIKKNIILRWDELSLIYIFVFSPYAGIIFFSAKKLFENIMIFRTKKIILNGLILILLFAFAPWGFGYQQHYHVKPWSGINFSMPEAIYYIRNYTKPDSLFLVPPVVWFIQPYGYRSTVVDYSHPGLDDYALEWKKRMDEITGIDIFGKVYKDINASYAEMPTDAIKNIIKKYQADYYMTFNSENLKDTFKKDKDFQLVYWDSEYLIYKVIEENS